MANKYVNMLVAGNTLEEYINMLITGKGLKDRALREHHGTLICEHHAGVCVCVANPKMKKHNRNSSTTFKASPRPNWRKSGALMIKSNKIGHWTEDLHHDLRVSVGSCLSIMQVTIPLRRNLLA